MCGSMKLLLLAIFLLAESLWAQGLPAGSRFVMSHFKATSDGGDQRLYISASPDGLNWVALNNGAPVWQPTPGMSDVYNVVRDPSIVFANGYYWVAYTSGYIGKHASFAVVKSADLLNWTFVTDVSTLLPGATDTLTWGPFFFEDGDGTIHLFVSIDPTGGVNFNPVPAMRTHELHPLNAGFTQWSAPVQLALPNSNTNEFWAWKEGATYHAIYADFGQGGAYKHVTASSIFGTWTLQSVLGFNSQEGGFMLRKPDGGHRFFVEPGDYQPLTGYRTCDFDANFTNPTPQVEVTRTVTMRNGKVTAARGTTSFTAWQAEKLASVPVADRAAGADPDADGLPNIVECALGTEPLTPTAPPQTFTRTIGGDTFAGLRFTRRRQFSDVSLGVEVAGDLGAWNSGAITESLTLQSDGTEWLHVRDGVATTSTAARFLRLKATSAPRTEPRLAPKTRRPTLAPRP